MKKEIVITAILVLTIIAAALVFPAFAASGDQAECFEFTEENASRYVYSAGAKGEHKWIITDGKATAFNGYRNTGKLMVKQSGHYNNYKLNVTITDGAKPEGNTTNMGGGEISAGVLINFNDFGAQGDLTYSSNVSMYCMDAIYVEITSPAGNTGDVTVRIKNYKCVNPSNDGANLVEIIKEATVKNILTKNSDSRKYAEVEIEYCDMAVTVSINGSAIIKNVRIPETTNFGGKTYTNRDGGAVGLFAYWESADTFSNFTLANLTPNDSYSLAIDAENGGCTQGDILNITAKGLSDNDILEIYPAENHKNISTAAPVKEYNVKANNGKITLDTKELATGDYLICLKNAGGRVARAEYITVYPNALASVIYEPSDNIPLSAKGYIKVTPTSENENNIVYTAFWANEKGRLEGYSQLCTFKGVKFEIPEATMVPIGADRIIVYAYAEKDDVDFGSAKYNTAMLPKEKLLNNLGAANAEFQVISDTHIESNDGMKANRYFKAALEQLVEYAPDSAALFVNGDLVQNGQAIQYARFNSLVKASGIKEVYASMGNHDYWDTSISGEERIKQFQRIVNGKSSDLPYFDVWVGGVHCIILGNENPSDNTNAHLSTTQLNWLSKKLDEKKNGNENAPVFVFLHQGIKDSVGGTFEAPGQYFDGVIDHKKLSTILSKHPEVILFSAHTHWDMELHSNLKLADGILPTTFNTASVKYLTTDIGATGNKSVTKDGSQGYIVTVYDNAVILRARDFLNNEWIASAQYIITGDFYKDKVSVTLSENLDVSYYVKDLSYKAPTMKFTLDGKTQSVNAVKNDAGELVFTLEGVGAECIADTIKAELVDEGKVVMTRSFSVKEYLLALNDKYSDNAALVKLINDLLVWGGNAQRLAEHNTDSLASEGAEESEFIPDTAGDKLIVNNGVNVSFDKKSIAFSGTNKLSVNFSAFNLEGIVIKCWMDGEEREIEYTQNNGVYTATTNSIKITGYDKPCIITAYKNGNVQARIAMSISAYACETQNENTISSELARAMYNCGKSLKEYLSIN